MDGASLFSVTKLGVHDPPSRLSTNGVIVSESLAKAQGLSVGDSVTMIFPNAAQQLNVDGIYTVRSALLGDAIIDTSLLARITPASVDIVALVKVDPAQKVAARTGVEDVAKHYGVTKVLTPEQLVNSRADVLHGFERVIQWMLLFSVALAVIGVANTLQLSVNERRRELGLLRTVGAEPGQVVRLVLVEAAALSVVGVIGGITLGVGGAFVAVRALASLGLGTFTLPVVVVAGTAVASLALGLGGAWLPALAASRTGIAEALGEDDSGNRRGLVNRWARYRNQRRSRSLTDSPPRKPRVYVNPPAPPPADSEDSGGAGVAEESMARCYQCGNDPGDGERCVVCGATQVPEVAGMFSTAPTTDAVPEPASGREPIEPVAQRSALWSTHDNTPETDHGTGDRWNGRDDIVDAAVIDDEDDLTDEPVGTPLGSIFDLASDQDERAERAGPIPAPPTSGNGHQAPPTTPPQAGWTPPAYTPPPYQPYSPPQSYGPPPSPYAQPNTFGHPPPAGPPVSPGDPNGLGAVVSRLAPTSQQAGAASFLVVGSQLGPDERVLGAVQGWALGLPTVAALTNLRVIVVGERRWKPLVDNFPLRPSLSLFGRHIDNTASITLQDGDHVLTLEQIVDVQMAVEMATTARSQTTSVGF